ncbi:MAG: hypothetical protein ACREAR_05880 [Nitrosotalea sp.]
METKGDPNDFMPMYNTLAKNESLYKTIQKVITDLQSDKIVGKRLRHEQIPKYYIKKHDVNAIYKVDLPGYWRLIYGITEIHGEKKAIMMELFNHEKYNKRFGY